MNSMRQESAYEERGINRLLWLRKRVALVENLLPQPKQIEIIGFLSSNEEIVKRIHRMLITIIHSCREILDLFKLYLGICDL